MVTVSELLARVVSDYERLDLPTWPDPHRVGASPGDEEYSRVTDPGRYRIVHARARAWAAVLEDGLGARTEILDPASDAAVGSGPFGRGIRIVPRHSDGLPLLLLERDVLTQSGEEPLAVLTVSVARPEIVVETQPDCGCDACDSGSSHLLEAIDDAVRHIVGGPFVVLRGQGWHAEWHPEGGSASSSGSEPDFHMLMDQCRQLANGQTVRLPAGTEVLIGRPWIR